MCTVMATCSETLVQHLINKRSANRIDKSFMLDFKKFVTTLHFYSPKTYELIQRRYGLCLPHPSVISMWYQQPHGRPGITEKSVEIMALAKVETTDLYWCVLVYEIKIQESVKLRDHTDTHNATTYYGYADVGNQLHGEHVDIANEALVVTIVSITSEKKMPFGKFFGRNFTASQKATLIKVCIDRLFALKLRIISVTLDSKITSVNLAGALGANIDTAPLKPYFTHNDTKYYLIIDQNLRKVVQRRNSYNYIGSVTDDNGDLIISTKDITFNIFLCNLHVLKCLMEDYIQSGMLKCLPTRKLVLENFEIFINNANFNAKNLSSIYDHLCNCCVKGLEI